MRVQTQIKIHELKGPRLPYKPEYAEIQENDYAYLEASGVLVHDSEGILYWIDVIATSDGGTAKVQDNTSASGDVLGGGYAAKATESRLKSYDPPIPFYHGIYASITTAAVRICYKPLARNLRCRVSPMHTEHERALVARLIVRVATSKNLVARLSPKISGATRSLVARVAPIAHGSTALVTQLTVRANSSTSLVCRFTNVAKSSTMLVCRVTNPSGHGVSNLVCHLYADRTE